MQDSQVVAFLKGLVIDGVGKAKSGHPGGPMSSMDFAYLLFTEAMSFDPDDPKWAGRDRFILSAGHMSMLQYSMHLGRGWLTMDDLKKFRQLHSRTPGHPENFMTPGVECTTGPLGQGCAMSVGFAVASSHLAATLDKELYGYRTWVICSDGDLQEGVALGAASLAGHLRLGNLTWVYDKNDIQLSGPTSHAVDDDVEQVFRGFGWQVTTVDGHDHAQIRKAYASVAGAGRPTLIVCKTVMAKGAATLEGKAKAHGEPFSPAERDATAKKLGIPAGESFYFPAEALSQFRRGDAARRTAAARWKKALAAKLAEPAFKKRYDGYFAAPQPAALPAVPWAKAKEIATRDAFGDVLKEWALALPSLIGGSADLEPSNKTAAFAAAVGTYDREKRDGRNINFGVREFPMSALCNGLALHGGFVPFDATFLSFADYSRPALRLGAIQKVRVLHAFTHDSFYLGEDGPTHQPVEQVMALRTIPDLYVMRPADPIETEVLMRKAVDLGLPAVLCLTRQKVPYLDLPAAKIADAARGGYVVHDVDDAELVLIATGSEVGLAILAARQLAPRRIRVVSLPCWKLFAEQPASYRDTVLPPRLTRRVSIEAGTTLGWHKFVGMSGLTIGLDHYGASAPAEVLAEEYGFTPAKICERIAKHQFQ